MCLFLLLECSTSAILSVEDFASKSFSHGLFATASRICSNPTKSESLSSFSSYFHRNLIGRTAYAASFNLKYRHDIFKSFCKYFERTLAFFRFYDCKCIVNYLLSNALLSVIHDVIHKLSNKL